MLEGIIIKGIGGFYYVKVGNEIYECRARGKFRKDKITPLVGDKVKIRVSDEDNSGYIEEIFERENELKRPPVSNINQAIIVFSVKEPTPNLWLLDRFLLLAKHNNLKSIICFNKVDLDGEKNETIKNIYEKVGYTVINTSKVTKEGLDTLREILKNNVTVFAGPSGVGKSSLLNEIQPNLSLKTGEISKKNKRGKHTTRHVELLELNLGGWVVDTPGFSSLDINFIDESNLDLYFEEISDYSQYCKFSGCRHYKEPQCAVKEAVDTGDISKQRYDNYIQFLKELSKNRGY